MHADAGAGRRCRCGKEYIRNAAHTAIYKHNAIAIHVICVSFARALRVAGARDVAAAASACMQTNGMRAMQVCMCVCVCVCMFYPPHIDRVQRTSNRLHRYMTVNSQFSPRLNSKGNASRCHARLKHELSVFLSLCLCHTSDYYFYSWIASEKIEYNKKILFRYPGCFVSCSFIVIIHATKCK